MGGDQAPGNALKGSERHSILDGVPTSAPALWVAYQYTAKAAKVGFDWDAIEDVVDKVREELEEIGNTRTEADRVEEIGDLLFVLVNWLRWLGVDDPEGLMRAVNAKFYRRFRYIEDIAAVHGKVLAEYSLAEMDAIWEEAKAKGL